MTKPVNRNRSGMTLVDVLMTVVIIAMLAALVVPAARLAIRSKQNALVASRVRQAVAAFSLYRSETGDLPPNQLDGTVPPAVADYFDALQVTSWWTQPTPAGGVWGWRGGLTPAVVIVHPTATDEQMQDVVSIFRGAGDNNFLKSADGYSYYLRR